MQESTKTHWVVWLSLVAGMTAFAFLIAEVIPFFDDLIGTLASLQALACLIEILYRAAATDLRFNFVFLLQV